MNHPNHVLEALQAWFVERAGADIDPDSAFLASGLVDSFDVIDLVLHIEQSFQIRLAAEDFQSPAFGTLQTLAGLVQARIDRV